MYRAAQQAGLIEDSAGTNQGSKHPLSIVLEPEAASLYCFNKRINPITASRAQAGEPYLVVGLLMDEFICFSNYILPDCGGGTVDLIVHKFARDESGSFHVEEVSEASGDLCGGTFVDAKFLEYCKANTKIKPGRPVGAMHPFDEFRQAKPEKFAKLMIQWEKVKTVCFFGI